MKNELKLYAVRNDKGEWLATSDHCGSFHWHAFFPFASTYHDRGQANTAIARFGGTVVAFVPESEVQVHSLDERIAYLESENKVLERELEAAHRSFAEVIDHVNGYNEDLAMIFVDHRLERMEQAGKESGDD